MTVYAYQRAGVGSQEWRPITNGTTRESWLSTRCGITAPGRSAGLVGREYWGKQQVWIFGNGPLAEPCKTRAEVAAGSWAADNPYDTWVLKTEAAWNLRQEQWKTQSALFWRDAYRVVR